MIHIPIKKVGMIELFYDLIYVVAIANVTNLIHHTHHGIVSPVNIIAFIGAVLIMLLMWFDETVYMNKHGSGRWYDFAGLSLHMFGAIYMSNNINADWTQTFFYFNVSVIIMTVAVLFQYTMRCFDDSRSSDAVKGQIKTNIVFLSVLVASQLIGHFYDVNIAIGITVALYTVTLFLPIIFKDVGDSHPVNFPHLVERASLITIITFGEMVTGIAKEFLLLNINLDAVVIFVSCVLLFKVYVTAIEDTLEHHQVVQPHTLIYSHMGIIIALILLTVSYSFIDDPSVNDGFIQLVRGAGTVLFILCLGDVVCTYNQTQFAITGRDKLVITLITVGSLLLNCVGMYTDRIVINVSMLLFSAALLSYQQYRIRTI